ncbi:hypothetical protein H5410_051851, partial [Solanum commersonii]
MSVKPLEMEPIGPDGQIDQFSYSNDPQSSNGASWSQRENGPIFKFQRAPKKVYPHFRLFSCAIIDGYLTSVKTLAMEPIGPFGYTGPFFCSNEPQSRNGASWSPRVNGSIFKFKRAPKQVNAHFVNFHLSNSVIWFPWNKGAILKFKRAPKQ